MELQCAIDLNNLHNLHKYSNINFSTIVVTHNVRAYIGTFDYTKLNMFIDIFDDVNKLEFDYSNGWCKRLSLADNIIYSIYNYNFGCTLTLNEQLMILFKLMQRGFSKSTFDYGANNPVGMNYELFRDNKIYLNTNHSIITNLIRLTNSDTINLCNIRDHLNTIKMPLLITKTRVASKYVILHKILLFYLC